MKLKHLVATLAMSVCISSTFASVSGPDPYAPIDVGTIAAGSSRTFSGYLLDGGMSDTYNFSLPSFSSLSGDVWGFSFTSAGGSYGAYDLILDGVTTHVTNGIYNFAGILGAGEHTISFGATANGADTYFGRMFITAVPEPESYAMFLAGLGLMGAIARRRRVG